MPLIVTPQQLEQRAEFYHQLGSLISAGVPIIQALEQLRRNPPSRSFRQPLERLVSQLNQGLTLTEGLNRSGNWLPSFDLALIEAGEKSGRLDACFRLIANYYRERAQIARRILGQLIYPAVLFHMAALIFPIQAFTNLVLKGDVPGYLMSKAWLLAVYAAILVGVFLCQRESFRALFEIISHAIPFLGKARRDLALARLAVSLEALINAGVPVFNAWELAATASGSSALKRRVFSWRPRLESGQTPGEALGASPEFPELFANLYHTGETSGQQDDALRRIHVYFQDQGTRRLEMFAQWLPRLIYFAIVILVAYRVITFWTGYFNTLGEVMR